MLRRARPPSSFQVGASCSLVGLLCWAVLGVWWEVCAAGHRFSSASQLSLHTSQSLCVPAFCARAPADMHWMLKVISLGHVRTFTHHRLLLLEQKFNLHVMLNAGGCI